MDHAPILNSRPRPSAVLATPPVVRGWMKGGEIEGVMKAGTKRAGPLERTIGEERIDQEVLGFQSKLACGAH